MGMGFFEPRFELARSVLESSQDVIFVVNSDLRLTYCNPAWDKFALENDGEDATASCVLGTDLMRAIPLPLRDFYRGAFQRCRQQGLAFELDYECSSAKMYRLLHMSIFPLKRSNELAVVNSTRVELAQAADQPPSLPAKTYLGGHGTIAMCCHCRRTRRQDGTNVWDWVPAYLETRKWKISHGMCPVCVSYFYSQYLNADA